MTNEGEKWPEDENNSVEGWSEIFDAEKSNLETATHQVYALRQLDQEVYKGVQVLEDQAEHIIYGDNFKKIDFKPTISELRSAPLALQRVFKDIGINSRDSISIVLGIPDNDTGFQFTLEPHDITNNKVGLTLSTITTTDNGVITPVYDNESFWGDKPAEIELYKFSHSEHGEEGGSIHPSTRGAKVFNTYTSIGFGNESSVATNPRMNKIMREAANWSVGIIAGRKKPTTPTS